jgi:hypothetical protein
MPQHRPTWMFISLGLPGSGGLTVSFNRQVKPLKKWPAGGREGGTRHRRQQQRRVHCLLGRQHTVHTCILWWSPCRRLGRCCPKTTPNQLLLLLCFLATAGSTLHKPAVRR